MEWETEDFNTQIIEIPPEYAEEPIELTVFICYGNCVAEYVLSGEQRVGRPADGMLPDIPIADQHVSRRHGFFQTMGDTVYYTTEKTTNGTLFNKRLLDPGERVLLKDGDEIRVPLGYGEDASDVTIVCAFSRQRLQFWRNVERSMRDGLTGLLGREGFIGWWLKNGQKKDYSEACLFILDIDDFKSINDRFGHAAGDEALVLLTDTIADGVRYKDQLCRWGGDEFVGIIPGSLGEARERLLRMGKAVSDASENFGIPFTISIGLTDLTCLQDRYDIGEAAALADKALYRAKNKGKNTMCICKQEGRG